MHFARVCCCTLRNSPWQRELGLPRCPLDFLFVNRHSISSRPQCHVQGEQLQPISRFQAVAIGDDIYIHTHRNTDDILRLSTSGDKLRCECLRVNLLTEVVVAAGLSHVIFQFSSFTCNIDRSIAVVQADVSADQHVRGRTVLARSAQHDCCRLKPLCVWRCDRSDGT